MPPTPATIQSITRARRFEDACGALLSELIRIAQAVLEAGEWREQGRILRASIHLRPTGGYRGLLMMEAGSLQLLSAGERTRLPSSTVWQALQQLRAPLWVDALSGELYRPDGSPLAGASAVAGQESLHRLKSREATHILILPLCAPGGGVAGMIAVEGGCRFAIGEPWIWPECAEELQFLADLAAPTLLALPAPAAEAEATDELLPVIGRATAPLIRMLRVFARQEETILISGPTGAGKSRLARWCHAQSARSKGPFETVDLQSVPEDLQLGTLFGWRRGAFTSAVRDQAGAVERARGGTLFIDEIDKLSLRAQAGLLRLIEERTFQVLGESIDRSAEARFLIGTNADLMALVREGRFREDLYYRIHVLPIRLPPLAERADELPAWIAWMLDRRHAGARGAVAISQEGLTCLGAYGWPGNLRQLDNVLRRAYTLARIEQAEQAAITVSEAHCRQALSYEGHSPADSTSPLLSLRAAASRIVEAARSREGTYGPLPLDLLSGFAGIVLAEAALQIQDREEILRLFGQEALIKNRNHHRTWKRELRQAADLCRALGERPPPEWLE